MTNPNADDKEILHHQLKGVCLCHQHQLGAVRSSVSVMDFAFLFFSLSPSFSFFSLLFIYIPQKTKKGPDASAHRRRPFCPDRMNAYECMNVWMYMDVYGCICKIPINIYSRVSIILHVLVELLAKNQALKTA